MTGKTILVTGPARSGKSEWAEQLAEKSQKSVVYIATAQLNPTDLDWQQRIAAHRMRRPAHWACQEVPYALADTIQQATPQQCLLIDSLGTWLANAIEQPEMDWQGQVEALLDAIATAPCDLILVAEEAGWGVIPAYPLGRRFRDRLGNLSRRVGAISTTVYLVTGGYALDLTSLGTPLGDGGSSTSTQLGKS